MPSEHPPSQSQTRPNAHHRSTSSMSQVDSPSTSPQHGIVGKPKAQKHVVHGTRLHSRVPSNKGMHKLTKAHGDKGSHTDLKSHHSSTTSLKKNPSHVSLKRNRSSADV